MNMYCVIFICGSLGGNPENVSKDDQALSTNIQSPKQTILPTGEDFNSKPESTIDFSKLDITLPKVIEASDVNEVGTGRAAAVLPEVFTDDKKKESGEKALNGRTMLSDILIPPSLRASNNN